MEVFPPSSIFLVSAVSRRDGGIAGGKALCPSSFKERFP
jgi:hypothetical protein